MMIDEMREGKEMSAYVHNLSSCLGECFYGVLRDESGTRMLGFPYEGCSKNFCDVKLVILSICG